MELDFYKLSACRNDFIVLNFLFKGDPPDDGVLPALSRRLCDRRTGVGANGVVYLYRGTEHPVRATAFGRDGRTLRFVNDALLCVGRLTFDAGISDGKKVIVETIGGPRTIDSIDSTHFRVSLGGPSAVDGETELRELSNAEYALTIEAGGKHVAVTPLRLQREGVVVFASDSGDDFRTLAVEIDRMKITNRTLFPVFCSVYSKEELAVQASFKHDTPDFASCAGLATIAAVVNGFAEREVTVHCNNDELYVQWLQASNEVLVTGGAEYAFTGTYYFDEERTH